MRCVYTKKHCLLPKWSLLSRWVTQWQLSSASILKCSCCQRKSYGCLTAPWDSEKEPTLLFPKVLRYCHLVVLSDIAVVDRHPQAYLAFPLPLTSGSMIYGRVMVDPVQNLGDSFSCSIEKVFLCTGTDGYVPKYNPTNREYGCLADAPSLLYRFKILVWYNKFKRIMHIV